MILDLYILIYLWDNTLNISLNGISFIDAERSSQIRNNKFKQIL